MAGRSPFTPVKPPTRRQGRSIKGLAMTVVAGLLIAVVIVALSQHPQTIGQTYGKVAALASPMMAGTSRVDLSLAVTPTSTAGPTINTTRTQITVPATETKDVKLSLKSGDKLVGIFNAPNKVDFSLWILSDPRQRLLQQVQVQGESTFSWTATQDGDYVMEFTAANTTDVSVAYAIRAK
jgi:hypothetical protein